jgi:hypothetical protein
MYFAGRDLESQIKSMKAERDGINVRKDVLHKGSAPE